MTRLKKRRLAAIMFTDIVGYSSMMQKNEALATRLRTRHREVFKRLHDKYGGEIIQYFGDGTLSVFDSTADAVECGIELQRELKKAPQVPIRIGIHTGDIMFNEEDIIGDGVNIAARIQSESVPGGIFISGKAHDDIKNNPEISTRPIGQSSLKNIQDAVDLYAVTNQGLTVPDYEWVPPKAPKPDQRSKKRKRRKKKWVAALLALFFGVFGIHRFYLDQRKLGILYFSLFFLGAFVFQGIEQLVAIPAILGFVDFMVFLATSRDSFDEKYNQEAIQQNQRAEQIARAQANETKRLLQKQREKYLATAQQAYENYDYADAIQALQKAIEVKYDDPETHFLLARCYSLLENTHQSLEHLDVAVAFGLAPERIQTEGDLAFLRVQPAFTTFANNDFKLSKELPAPTEDYLDLEESVPANLLEQLAKLEKEREAGLLTEEEFRQREQALRSREAGDD